MVKKGFFIIAAFVALALASEEDNEQKKRGAGKANTLNAIPTGAQKPDYTYSIYGQSPSAQSSPSQPYQSQVPNSFYPNQIASQYYTSSNNPDQSTSNALHTQVNSNINSQIAQPSQSHFVPINFIPNPGYQLKYQIQSPKPSGNLQFAFIQQPSMQPSSLIQYPHSFFSPSHTNHVAPQSAIFGSPGHFSFAPALQPLSLGGSFLGQPSMVVLPQTHTGLYNNLVYPNPSQSFYNYYPSTSQAKYSYASGPPITQSTDQAQSSIPQSVTKEDNIISQSSEYSPSDTSSGFKNSYTRSTYSKL
ncbi:uncharacterized protein [Maniola hyperantus]|uniref:uncharacterized protein n=1 Tax=Aphantopus hyperantus TaxID=2795564 RepID=UPI00156A31FB|nr:uncharacterized protein LOC117989647 [Maniola hyperantus]